MQVRFWQPKIADFSIFCPSGPSGPSGSANAPEQFLSARIVEDC